MSDERGFLFNRIIVIESLRPGDKNTGTDLYNGCLQFYKDKEDILKVELRTVQNKSEFQQLFKDITHNVISKDYSPVIHIEAHGSIDELQFTSGETIGWSELSPILRDLNIAMKNNLLITVSACFGAHLIKTASITKRSPFYMMVGPEKTVDENDLLAAFLEFYQTFLFHMDILQAIKNINLKGSQFGVRFPYVSSEQLFYGAFKSYVKENCNKDAVEERIKRNQKELDEIGEKLGKEATINCFRQIISSWKQIEADYERYKRYFLMTDLEPYNSKRGTYSFEQFKEKYLKDFSL